MDVCFRQVPSLGIDIIPRYSLVAISLPYAITCCAAGSIVEVGVTHPRTRRGIVHHQKEGSPESLERGKK